MAHTTGPAYPGAVDSRPGVTLTLWHVPVRLVPAAAARMALDRPLLRRTRGLRFAKLLGTGDGRTFTLRDAEPQRWGLLTVWDDDASARAFEAGRTHARWARLADESLHVRMTPLSSRGTWARREPFGRPVPRRVGGPVAAITRARLRPLRTRAFWRAVPPVSADLRSTPGLLLAVGIGEAPVGLQGTFSLWRDAGGLTDFAHRGEPHREAVRRTAVEQWYAEELFARFEVLSVEGTFEGRRLLDYPSAATGDP
jgi:hypothetical protein